MNAPLRKPMTLDEFLAWEERQEFKHEFDGFEPVAIAGGTLAHATLQANLAISVGGRLRGTPRRITIPLAELYADLDLSQPIAAEDA